MSEQRTSYGNQPRNLARDLIGAGVGALVLVLLLMWVGVGLSTHAWAFWGERPPRGTDWGAAARIAVPGAALAAGAIAAVVAFHGQRTRQSELEVSRDANVTDRYTKAIEQLGNENVFIQIGGIYALERIARDSKPDRATVCQVLEEKVRRDTPQRPPDEYVPDPAPEPSWGDFTLREVGPGVFAAMKSLSRLRVYDGGSYNLRGLWLVMTDLTGAQLAGADLTGSYLSFAGLQGADLTDTTLTDCDLLEAALSDAILRRTHLENATLERAWLTDASAVGASFANANMTKANLTGADLSGADFTGATLNGASIDAHALEAGQLTATQSASLDQGVMPTDDGF